MDANGPPEDHSGSSAFSEEERARIDRLGLSPEDCYFTPEGYLVYTEAFHLKRGYCCESGCRHCPYGFNKKKGGSAST